MTKRICRTHIMALTYSHKIDAVKTDVCKQTIRVLNVNDPKMPGDGLLLHTWKGSPYRTPWDWRGYFIIKHVDVIGNHQSLDGWEKLCENGVPGLDARVLTKADMDEYARKDFINPPTGEELERVLFKLNKNSKKEEATFLEVITWW